MTVLIKFYDKLNLGDDLFVWIIAERYTDKLRIPSSYTLRSQGVGTKPFGKNQLRLLAMIGKILRKANYRYVYSMRSSDAMLYIGGSIFIDNRFSDWHAEAEFYQGLKKPYYILGSNVGPYKSDKFLHTIRPIFEGAADVCFRDRASYELYKDLPNVRVASDIVFSMDTEKYQSVTVEKKVVFSIIDAYKKFDKKTAEKYEAETIALTNQFVAKGYGVVYMSFCKYEGDEGAIEKLIAEIPHTLRNNIKKHYYRGDIDSALREVASSEVVVGSRFHANILGLLFEKKVLPFAYSDKTTNILADMNFNGPVVDIRKISDFNGAEFDLSSLRINDISEQIELAELQFAELDKILTKQK